MNSRDSIVFLAATMGYHAEVLVDNIIGLRHGGTAIQIERISQRLYRIELFLLKGQTWIDIECVEHATLFDVKTFIVNRNRCVCRMA